MSGAQQYPVLKYGMKIQILATSPLSDKRHELYPISVYHKHDLLCLGAPQVRPRFRPGPSCFRVE